MKNAIYVMTLLPGPRFSSTRQSRDMSGSTRSLHTMGQSRLRPRVTGSGSGSVGNIMTGIWTGDHFLAIVCIKYCTF